MKFSDVKPISPAAKSRFEGRRHIGAVRREVDQQSLRFHRCFAPQQSRRHHRGQSHTRRPAGNSQSKTGTKEIRNGRRSQCASRLFRACRTEHPCWAISYRLDTNSHASKRERFSYHSNRDALHRNIPVYEFRTSPPKSNRQQCTEPVHFYSRVSPMLRKRNKTSLAVTPSKSRNSSLLIAIPYNQRSSREESFAL